MHLGNLGKYYMYSTNFSVQGEWRSLFSFPNSVFYLVERERGQEKSKGSSSLSQVAKL